ncbi:Triose-phosphate Transporter [Gamsiella multidivaricata]|nr:Triose-phosphate Transporter [Gamsiella multidivaricata]
MVDSLESSSALSRTTETTVTHVNGNSIQGTSILEVRNGQDPGRGRGFHRSDNVSDSDSSSSDDGIEWDNSGYYTSEHTSEDDGGDGYSSDDDAEDESDGAYDEQDRQRLLASSSKVRVGGMGVGMRVGETGTGTTIGLDFERDNIQNDGDYDVLPLMNVGQGAIRTEQEQSIVKRQLRIEMFWNVFYVFAWYGCSTSLSFYNKWLFSPLHYNFRFPLFTTCLHMVAEFVLASLTLIMIPSLRPSAAPSVKDFGTKIMPCAVASGLDIGLSNNSLKSITLAFYSKDYVYRQCDLVVQGLTRPTWTLAGVIGVICVGLFMMVMSEADFVLIGFIQVMLASVLGGLRWSLTQLLLERTDTKSGSLANPISTIFFLSPIMGICLCIVAGMFEGYGDIFRSEFFSTVGSSFGTLSLLFLGGIFAFTMIVAEFNLIARTSVVSLSVLGIIKEVVTIVISSLVFHDRLTIINILGLVVTLSGIGFYHYMKLHELKSRARRAAKEIMELNSASSTNRIDRSVDLAPFQDYRRKRHSGRSKGRSGHRSLREEARNNVEIEGRRAGSSEGLYGRELMGPNGAEQTVGRSQLIRDLDGTSPTNLNSS